MLPMLTSVAFAQESMSQECGALCDFSRPVLLGTPVVCGFLGAVIVVALHMVRVRSVARTWMRGRVSTFSLWALPVASGYALLLASMVALVMLAWLNPDFRTLVAQDAVTAPPIVAWVLGFILPVVPFGFAAASRA